MASERIQVLCRVRPGNTQDRGDEDVLAWCEATGRVSPLVPPAAGDQLLSPRSQGERVYDFKKVLGPGQSNLAMFDSVREAIESATDGINATIMAYGHTSAGKTHTMLGTPHEPGIILRSVEYLLNSYATWGDRMDDDPASPATPSTPRTARNREPKIVASYFEIYMEKVWDLLSTDRKEVDVYTVEDTAVVQNVTTRELNSLEDCVTVVSTGQENRRIARTTLNERSSRGHTIFQLDLHLPNGKYARLRLVDLAGSENAKQAGTTGEMQREGGAINRSLLALTNVIQSLATAGATKTTHIPYRDAKLTRILQSSLGGNSKTRIICCIASKRGQLEDTLATLMFSDRAKAVKNVVKANNTAPIGFCGEPENVTASFSSNKEKASADLVQKYKTAAEEIAESAQDLLSESTPSLDEVHRTQTAVLVKHLLGEMKAEADLWREVEYQLQKKCYSLTESFQKKMQRMEERNEKREAEALSKEAARGAQRLEREVQRHADEIRLLRAEHATVLSGLEEENDTLRTANETLMRMEHAKHSATEPYAGTPPRPSYRDDSAWERKIQELQDHHHEEFEALKDSTAGSMRAREAEHEEAITSLSERLADSDVRLELARAELEEQREGGTHPQAAYYKEKYETSRTELREMRLKMQEVHTVQRQCTERLIEAKTVQVTTRRSLKRAYEAVEELDGSGDEDEAAVVRTIERHVHQSAPCPQRRLVACPQPPRPYPTGGERGERVTASSRTRTPQKQRSYSAATACSTPKQRGSQQVSTPKSTKV